MTSSSPHRTDARLPDRTRLADQAIDERLPVTGSESDAPADVRRCEAMSVRLSQGAVQRRPRFPPVRSGARAPELHVSDDRSCDEEKRRNGCQPQQALDHCAEDAESEEEDEDDQDNGHAGSYPAVSGTNHTTAGPTD